MRLTPPGKVRLVRLARRLPRVGHADRLQSQVRGGEPRPADFFKETHEENWTEGTPQHVGLAVGVENGRPELRGTRARAANSSLS
jgi:hypothetical protein